MKRKKWLWVGVALILIVVLVYLYWPVERAYNRAEAEALANAEENWYIVHQYPEKTSDYYYFYLKDDKKIAIYLRSQGPSDKLGEEFLFFDDDPTNSFLIRGTLLSVEFEHKTLVYTIDVEEWYILAPLVRNTNKKWVNMLLPRHYICMWDVLLGNYKR